MTGVTVPIIPGPDSPVTLPSVEPTAPPRKRRLWPWIAVAAVVTLAAMGGMYLFLFKASGLGQTALRGAYEKCEHIGRLADGDKTLILDLYGDKTGTGTVRPEDLRCYVAALPIPTFVVTKMEHTRALDGQVEETWDGFKASWTYHPDAGLDLVIREL